MLFTGLGILLAGPIASLYGEPDAKPLLVALSASFFVTAAGATQLTLMMRVMDFRRSELLGLAGSVGGAICGVVLAARGAGAWALVMQQIAATALTTALVWWRSEWYPRFMFSLASLRDLGSFSIYMLGQRIVYYLQVNGDRFLIGRYLGTTALGTYAVAYNTMLVPASKIGGPLQRVFSPAFSRIQDEPERIAAAWARVVRVIGLVALPSLGGPHRRRARLRAGRPRVAVEGRGAGGADPRVGRHHPGGSGAELRRAHGARPRRGRCSASRSCSPRATSSPSVWACSGA